MTSTVALIASIPSPSSGAIKLGSLQLRMYGLMIALAVIAAVWLAGRRLEAKGVGTRDQMASIALWAVPAGIIGARLYHVVTDWQLFRDDPGKSIAIWEGGLGIWGGIGLGVAVGLWRAHRLGIPLRPGLDAVVPALPLAQAIGRLGNWWNQELFGRPTTLPWGLEISPQNRPEGYAQYATFHPTFLYEALWNLALMAVLIWIDKKGWLRPGRLILVYVAGYTFARFFIEGLRIDTANKFGGLRVNEWVSLVIFVIAVVWLVIDVVRHRNDVPEISIPDAETVSEVEVAAMVAPEASTTFDDPANALVGAGGEATTPAPSSTAVASTGESAANRRLTDDRTFGGEAVADDVMAGDLVPDESAPGESVPGESVPGESVPGESVPDESVRGESARDADVESRPDDEVDHADPRS